jgi:hypothetical protein
MEEHYNSLLLKRDILNMKMYDLLNEKVERERELKTLDSIKTKTEEVKKSISSVCEKLSIISDLQTKNFKEIKKVEKEIPVVFAELTKRIEEKREEEFNLQVARMRSAFRQGKIKIKIIKPKARGGAGTY